MKQMEVVLREVTKYKYKLSANINTVTHEAVGKLNKAGLSLETIICDATIEYYKEATKTVVIVDHEALSRIRQEALVTQEKLMVPEQEKQFDPVILVQESLNLSYIAMQDKPSMSLPEIESNPVNDAWKSLKNKLTEIEIEALSVVLHGGIELKKYADECGIMLEVLFEGINEKAIDFIGDNLLDDEFVLYDDYKEHVKGLIG